MPYALLFIAVLAETVGTTALKATEGFTRAGPSIIVVLAYAVSFYFLSLTLKTMPVGIMYAIWSGAGIVLIALIAWLLYGQNLDWPAILGMGLILSGILVIHLFSSAGH